MDRYSFVERFISQLEHATGKWAGLKFNLLDWQKDILKKFYSTTREQTFRQYQYLYLEIPKKNGKTELAGALALYHLFCDGEINGEVYGCAAEKGQAGIAFDVAVDMIDRNKYLKERSQYFASARTIKDKITGSKYKVLSADAYSKHGYKPSCVIFDELHAQPNRKLWDVMTFGAGDIRDQPVWIIITTAGQDPDRHSIGWEIHEKARKIIDGELIDDRWCPKIYGITDECKDIWDEKVWHEVNPSLGKTIPLETVRKAAESAKNSEAEEQLFRWLRLNQWVALKTSSWLPLYLWDQTISVDDSICLEGKECYGGLDLSSTTDITAMTLLFPPQRGLYKWYMKYFAWIPEDNIEEREKKGIPYQEWVKEGHIKTTEGNVVDYDWIKSTIIKSNEMYDIRALGVDIWNSRMLTQELIRNDVIVKEVAQTLKSLSPSMKRLEELYRSKQIEHEDNPCARWNFGNTVVVSDGNYNIKPVKNKSYEKIDITVSGIIAMAAAMDDIGPSIYEDGGLTKL